MFFGPVVGDRMATDDSTLMRDLHSVTDSYLNRLASILVTGPIGGGSEADTPRLVNFADHRHPSGFRSNRAATPLSLPCGWFVLNGMLAGV